jgi:amyloid beta A4 precursor protein-binding family B protein 1-interacting protein
MLLEEFFTTGGHIELEGPLYLKSDSRKGWKRFHFVLRTSGLYYYPKEQKTRSIKDLVCLALFAGHNVYKGIGWKKKHKSPTDFTFAMKCPKTNAPNMKAVKMMCAEDTDTMEKWVTAIRVVKVRIIFCKN